MSPLPGMHLFISILFLLPQLHKVSATEPAAGRAIPTHGKCNLTCGTVPVMFPFGTGFGCGHPYFARYVKCNAGVLQFSTGTGIYTVSSIDYPTSTIVVVDPFMSTCSSMQNSGSFSLDRASPFTLTGDNIFVLLGCSTTSPVFDRSEDLCDTGSGSRVCSGLYSCKGVTGIGLPENAPTSTCCVYDSLMGVGSGFSLDLPKLQCSSYTSIYEFGDEGDPMKWKFGISLQYNDSYYSPACKNCETSGGLCGFSVLDQSFSCICRDGVNTTTNCYGHGYSWSGAWEPKIQTKIIIGEDGMTLTEDNRVFGRLLERETLYEVHDMFVGKKGLRLILQTILLVLAILQEASSHGVQPLSRIAVHKTTFALDNRAFVKASPTVLGLNVSFYLQLLF
ncbi:hypothetical protein COLO4_27884 [Corchorus olitorius]|uniref:non-specific serine/threonine protein kinase n=1 Tax=Corchorus olitorius TaxID=93759 RepID=A0A1R3HNR9_9ROSI|nr:hypothetical protein COLO4_27884 [Corchorus olitorius]